MIIGSPTMGDDAQVKEEEGCRSSRPISIPLSVALAQAQELLARSKAAKGFEGSFEVEVAGAGKVLVSLSV